MILIQQTYLGALVVLFSGRYRSFCNIYINLCPTSLAKIVPGMALKALPECREVELRYESTYSMFHAYFPNKG